MHRLRAVIAAVGNVRLSIFIAWLKQCTVQWHPLHPAQPFELSPNRLPYFYRWCRPLLPVVICSFAFANSAGATAIRVNAGGNNYTDSAGNLWVADTGYNTGRLTNWGTPTITGTTDPTLFWTEHWDVSPGPELQYAFTVPNGNYQVKLYFAENTFTSAGARNFSVQIEGTTVFSNIDVYAEVGFRAALVKTATATITDGQLNITFLHGTADAPLINAIEILSRYAGAHCTDLPYRHGSISCPNQSKLGSLY